MSDPDYGVLIRQLAIETDPHKREQLAARLANRLEAAFTTSVNTAQVVRWETEEWLRQRVGETNDLVSELHANQQAVKGELSSGFDALQQALAAFRTNQEAAVGALRAEFQEVGESLSQFRQEFALVSEDVAVLKEAGMRQEKFNNALVRSIDGLGTRMSYLEAGQAALVGRVDRQVDELKQGQSEIKDEMGAMNARHGQQIEAFKEAFIASSKDEALRYRALLDELLKERSHASGGE